MKVEGRAKLLSIYLGESDHLEHRPLYEVIIERLRERGLAGATVLRGVEGFGRHSRIHTASILRLSEDLPIVVQAVDTEEKIRAALPAIDELVTEGMVTLTDVDVIVYRSSDE